MIEWPWLAVAAVLALGLGVVVGLAATVHYVWGRDHERRCPACQRKPSD